MDRSAVLKYRSDLKKNKKKEEENKKEEIRNC